MEQIKDPVVLSRLESLGFKAAGAKVKELSVRKRKMALAYEHYRFVRPQKIDEFNAKLRAKTAQGYNRSYQTLSFTLVEHYPDVPPAHVLDKMEEAVGRDCFDVFEVAHIVNVKDPILFGRVHGCPDLFYIDQWDDDVKIEDILAPNEG